jgi:hypothetical protein
LNGCWIIRERDSELGCNSTLLQPSHIDVAE